MTLITPFNLILLVILTLFTLGVLMILIGMYLLIFRATGKEIKTLTSQTNRLIQKGIAEDISSLIGQASTLLTSLNELIKNTAGVGVSLILIGLGFLGLAAFIAFQLYR